jgi:peptide/nickel transport system permease protein
MIVVNENGKAPVAAPSLWRRTGWGLRVGLVILLVHLLAAVFGPWLAPFGPRELNTGIPLSGISPTHLFGTDQLGRDVFSRVLHGAHLVILLSVGGTLAGLMIGAAIGLFSAYKGSWIDELLQRIVEGFVSIPFIVLGLLAVHAAGPEWAGQPILMVFVLTIIYAPRIARMARAAALDVITQDFVLAARLRGERAWSVMWFELAPNVTSTLIVEFALRTGYAPALIATLGFLGFGVQPPTPEWGSIISENRSVFLLAPAIVLGPGVWLATLVIGINMVTEGMSHLFGRRVEVASQ